MSRGPTRRELLLAAFAAPVLAACGRDEPRPPRWEAGDKRDLSVDTWNRRAIEVVPVAEVEPFSVPVFLWLEMRTDDVRALDALCGCGRGPGGCPVRWVDGARRFVCPCHGGIYGAGGEPLGGPARRPLAGRPVTVEGETVYVGPARR